MKKHLFTTVIIAAYLASYCDWLQPGFLKFGLPAAWDKPLSTAITYDLAAGVRRTAHCAVLDVLPDWTKPTNWRSRDLTIAPKTCQQRLREQSD